MIKNCTYRITGETKRYSYEGLVRALSERTPVISNQAREFLRSKLGMLDSQIEIVKGLIDSKAIGRFKADGDILLTGLATDATLYHEAFHRVYRTALTPKEREDYTNYFKSKRNWAEKIAQYATTYFDKSIEDRIEERLADDFADFMLNPDSTTVVDKTTRTLFEKILDFIKKLVGLKQDKIRMLYNDIAAGKYLGRQVDPAYRYNMAADKIEIGANTYSADIKNEFVQAVAREYINELINAGSIYSFIKGGVSPSLQSELYGKSFGRIIDVLYEDFPEMMEDFVNDWANGPDSYINQQFKQYLESLIGKLDLNLIEETEAQKDMDDANPGDETGRQQDDASPAWTASIEIDPKTSMSKAIKILLASLEDWNNINALGLPSQVRWTKAFNRIAQHLAGIPTSDSIEHLAKLASTESWVTDLIDRLGGTNPQVGTIDEYTARLRNEFIKTFAKTAHTYMMIEVNDSGIKMFDANQNTAERKKLREWNSAMSIAMKNATTDGSFDGWLDRVKTELVENKNAKDTQFEELLGISIDPELKNQPLYNQNGQDYYYVSAMRALANNIVKAVSEKAFSNTNLPDYNNLFGLKQFNVEGSIKKLAAAQNEYEDVVDFMVYSRDKKLYGISLNTHTTHTINTLNYISGLINPNDSLPTKLAVIEKYLPNILNYQTVNKVGDDYVVKSKWLNHILDGNKLKVIIMDGIKTTLGDSEATADINETDLYAITLNASVRGTNLSFKHSDRSIFYGYQMENSQIFDYQAAGTNNADAVLDYLTTVLQDQLATEVKRANLNDIPMFQYFKDKYKSSPLFAMSDVSKADPYSPDMQKMLKQMVVDNYNGYKAELDKWQVSENGVSPDLLAYHNGDVDLLIASSLANQMLTHLEEMKLMIGDFSFFKTAEDFYKRMSTTSGTGDMLVNDEFTNATITKLNQVKFDLRNPKTGEMSEQIRYTKPVDGTFTAITIAEKDDYFSKDATDLTQVSPINGEMISTSQYNYEWNMLQDYGEDVTEGQKRQIVRLAKSYADNYKKVNENDGQSWMNMFFFREYMMRLGQWTREMQNLFIAELKILNATSIDEIRDLTVRMGGIDVRVFDNENWSKGWFESVHTLKSQYAGFTKSFAEARDTMIKDYNERIRPYTIYKTSYHVLWPSVTFGRNLSQLHHFMLKNNVDVVHMNSANKSGGIDVQSVFKNTPGLDSPRQFVADNGFNFYDENGHFNDSVFDGELGNQLLNQSLTLAQIDSLKDQVRIGNHEKDTIKGSTQSLKIMLSNLIVNGKPRFPGAEILVQRYKDIVARLVNASIDELKEELGFDGVAVNKLEELVDTIKQAAADRSSAVNVIEAIEAFMFDPYMESLPNRTKMENIFFSIITNNVINFKRPGNSYPQVTSTGFEQLGEREVDGANIPINSYLDFYKTVLDDNGNIIKVNPSQLTIPLPQAWIANALTMAKTNNIVTAIQYLNENLASGKLTTALTFKGLRIPNQALSSNDIFTVKEFTLPTNTNFAVVPSEIVTKVGADFDIDKLNIYWTPLGQTKMSPKDRMFKELLDLEKEILLHPRNSHQLLTPVIDDLLKKDAFNEIIIRLKGESKDKTTFMQSLTPQKNVEKAIQFIKSKNGVGAVALDTTGHAVFMVDNINLNKSYIVDGEDEIGINLRFEGMENNYSLTSMYDEVGRIISEVQSQTMNSQVDAGKDPYAVQLGINNQTLGMIMYLLRRGVPIITTLKFINQPLIQSYLIAQRNNESLINKQRGNELDKPRLIKKVLIDNGYRAFNKSAYELDNSRLVMDTAMLDEGITNGGAYQVPMFVYFLRLVDETAAFSDLKNALTVDTKGKKDKSAVEEFEALWDKVYDTALVSKESLDYIRNDGLLAPFFTGQKMYRQIYFPYYAIDKSQFGTPLSQFKELVASRQKGAFKKEKARTTIENDFMLYVIQNYNTDFTLDNFEEMFGLRQDKSIAEQIKNLQSDPNFKDNIVVKALFPLVSIAKDVSRNKMIDALRLFERELTTIDLNDFIDSMKDIRDEVSEDLYKSIIRLSIYQAGFLNSPFSLNKIFPVFKSSKRVEGKLVEFQNDYLREIQMAMLKVLPTLPDSAWSKFEELFFRNNPDFLPTKYSSRSKIRYFNTWNNTTKKRELIYRLDNESEAVYPAVLGNTYFKQYFNQLAIGTSSILIEEQPLSLYDVQPAIINPESVIDNNFSELNRDKLLDGIVVKITKSDSIWYVVTRDLGIEPADGFIFLSENEYDRTVLTEVSIKDIISTINNKPLINDFDTMEKEMLNNFEAYFPNYAHYNDEQRRIVIQSVKDGDTELSCSI